jgi:hypothetical protein
MCRHPASRAITAFKKRCELTRMAFSWFICSAVVPGSALTVSTDASRFDRARRVANRFSSRSRDSFNLACTPPALAEFTYSWVRVWKYSLYASSTCAIRSGTQARSQVGQTA